MAGNMPHPGETSTLRIVQAVRDLFQGRSNAVGVVTLAAEGDDPVTSTIVVALNIGPDSKIFLMPTTASAAAEFASGDLYISSVGPGSFTIAHTSDAAADRTFFWVALG